MSFELARGSLLWNAVIGISILLSATAVAVVVHWALRMVANAFASRTKTSIDDLLLRAIDKPLMAFIVAQGLFLGLSTTSLLDRWQGYVNKAWLASVLATVMWGLQAVVSAMIQWYGQDVATKTKTRLDEKLLPLVRRFVTISIYVVGGLLILDNVGIQLTPLIAGLGLGGLAVALALQPTLSNFIASAFVVADGTIGVGDFIELQGGPMGNVVDVGWRSTKVQTPPGNVVVIPNSKLVDTIVTNYQAPTPEMSAVISCGISYESDMTRVEKLCEEVGREVIHDLPESVVVKDFQPIVRYREFGESNINFIVILRAKDRGNTFLVTHEFMKRLHARFVTERIEINYPVRKLLYSLPGSR